MDAVKRGRPKSAEVAARDEAVRILVEEEGPLSRNQIRDRIGSRGALVWLSLDRLRGRGLVTKCLDVKGNAVWCRPENAPEH